jgi:cytochrome c peroxidase
MFELFFFNTVNSHFDDFLDEGVFGDDELTLEGSK